MTALQDLPRLQRRMPMALPIRVVQFGQGHFLRGFFGWMLQEYNLRCGGDLGVVVVRPTSRSTRPLLDTQDGLYTTVLRGLNREGQLQTQVRRVTCVQRELDLAHHHADFLALARSPDVRFFVSNTTEAGIAVNTTDCLDDAPASTFPAKLTRWLFERYHHFAGDPARGVILLPCELIEANGAALRSAVAHYAALWQLEPAFQTWLDQSCHFCSTLVDRIVTGYPADEIAGLQAELGYRDDFLVAGERYHYWAIQAPPSVAQELPLQRAGLNVQWVEDLAPIRLRKVAILNGAHTVLAALGILAGVHTVGQAMSDPDLGPFLRATLWDEIIPALPFPQEALRDYAADVLLRFANPHIQHQLTAIALNMESKCLARLLPQISRFQQTRGFLPPRLVLALAAATQGLEQASEPLDRAMAAVPGLHAAVDALRGPLAAQGVRVALQRARASA